MLPRDTTYAFTIDGVELVATVSPCSFGDPHCGVQAHIELPETGQRFFKNNKRYTPESMTLEEFQAQCRDAVQVARCSCGKPRIIDPQSNRGDQCELCWLAEFRAQIEAEQAAKRKKERKKDLQHLASGYAHKLVAWIHSSGDDKQLVGYFANKPSKKQIEAILKRKGSIVLDDYSLTEIKPD